ncbi:hypothetical protein NDU88_001201 [Pleurodeles waltl]|uniref:Uncharacterized protein n=1 Tax=Pleurodeles waltl TaxID=8319 RepID=A0AAV7V8Z1_PLEWA|nr:hypothetical protein NDU88_001201 [Pleurodeles waltl]
MSAGVRQWKEKIRLRAACQERPEHSVGNQLMARNVVARVYRAPLAVRSNEGIAKYKREDIYLAAPATDILFTRPLHRFQETVHTESEDTGVDGCRERVCITDVVARVYRAPLVVRSNEGIAKYKREDIYLASPATDILFTRPLHRFQETVHTESEDTGVDGCRER